MTVNVCFRRPTSPDPGMIKGLGTTSWEGLKLSYSLVRWYVVLLSGRLRHTASALHSSLSMIDSTDSGHPLVMVDDNRVVGSISQRDNGYRSLDTGLVLMCLITPLVTATRLSLLTRHTYLIQRIRVIHSSFLMINSTDSGQNVMRHGLNDLLFFSYSVLNGGQSSFEKMCNQLADRE